MWSSKSSSVWALYGLALSSIKRNSGTAAFGKASHGLQGYHPYSAMRWHFPHQWRPAVYDCPTWCRFRQGFLCPKVVDFTYVGRMITGSRFQVLSRWKLVAIHFVCWNWYISEKNTLLILMCRRMVCFRLHDKRAFLCDIVRGITHHWTPGVKDPFC